MPAPEPSDRQLLSPRQVEAEYGIPFRTLEFWRYRGRGPAYYKISKTRVRYLRSEIDAWLLTTQVEPDNGAA